MEIFEIPFSILVAKVRSQSWRHFTTELMATVTYFDFRSGCSDEGEGRGSEEEEKKREKEGWKRKKRKRKYKIKINK